MMHAWDSGRLFALVACAAFFLGINLIAHNPGAPTLFGSQLFPSLGVILTVLPVIAVAVRFLHTRGVPLVFLAAFVVWSAISLHYIHISNDRAYTNDVQGHLVRIEHVANNWLNPYGSKGTQNHHPPAYYYMAAVFQHFADQWMISKWTALRFFSWLCYVVFACYGIRTIMLANLPRQSALPAGLLFLLWPGTFHLASKISPEPLYFALYAAAFYHVMRAYTQAAPSEARKALAISALALTVRSGAFILCAVTGLIVMLAYVKKIFRHEALRPWLWVALVVAACLLVNAARIFYGANIKYHMGIMSFTPDVNFVSWRYFFLLNPFDALENPFHLRDKTLELQGYWDSLVKTSVFGAYAWPSRNMASGMIGLLYLLMLYIAAAFAFAGRRDLQGLAPHAINIVLSLAGSIIFVLLTRNFPSSDARYVFPILISGCVIFGVAHRVFTERLKIMAHAGTMLALCFVLLGVVYFSYNHR